MRHTRIWWLLAVLVGGTIGWPAMRADEFESRYEAVIAAKGAASERERLHELFTVDWDYAMASSPETATYVGHAGLDTKWTDLSPAAIARRKEGARRPRRVLATIDRQALSAADRVSYDLFKRLAEEAVEGARFPSELLQVTQLNGIQQDPAQLFGAMPASTSSDFEAMLARLRALPALVDQSIALLEEGLARGVTPPRITLRDVPAQVSNQIPDDPFASPLLGPLADLPPTISGEEGLKLRAEAARIYANEVKPAYERLRTYLVEKYLPGARETTAAGDLPDGAAWYQHQIKVMTTTDLTARQVHEIGLAEVKRIGVEMERVKRQTGFEGTLEEFFTFVRTDPQFFFNDKEALLSAYRDIAKRADPQLVKLFKTLPRTPYGVQAVPAYAEQSQTTAYYYPGATDVGRPGYFFANTYALHTRPKWEMEALTLHEAVPGHHLQISLAQELGGDIPKFRKWGGYTAFVEGWGLYAEHLGEEMGFYADPYSKFGQLTYEMWRAVRLVVDTGMHALGWSREQAIAYFAANAGKSEHDIVVEIDRYLVWPGQALAYKVGELKLKELRAGAQQQLGAKFDVRLFHDEVLKHGAVPLSVLEANIDAWVAEQKAH